MPTKKKAATKKAIKMDAPRLVLEIFILPDVQVRPDPVLIDEYGVRHSPKVFWQAVDVTKSTRLH